MWRPWFVPLAACLANIIIALFVYRRGASFRLNRLFTITTATIISWNLNLFSLYFFDSPSRALFWSTLFRTGTLLMPPSIVHLFLVFGERESKGWRNYLAAAYGLAALLVVANFSGWLVESVRPIELGYYPVARSLYSLHVLSVVVNFVLAAYLLVTNVTRLPSPHKRLQAKFWLLGAGVGIAGGMTNLLPIYHFHVYPVGNLANVVYTGVVSYAILRHRLVDIDVVLARAISYALVGLGLILPAFGGTVILQHVSFGRVDRGFSAAMLIVFVGIGLGFQALRFWAETRVAHSLFGRKEKHRNALRTFTKGIVRIVERDRLVGELGRVLVEGLNTKGAVVFLEGEDSGKFEVCYRTGAAEPVVSEDFVRFLAAAGRASLREEAMEERIGDVAKVFETNGWHVCVPILLSGNMTGFFALVGSLDGEAYTSGDLDLLDTVAGETAIALENARLYEELRRSQEVIHRAGRLSALGTLAAGIAHEIRNPLVSIRTFFQLAPDRVGDEDFMNEFLKLTEAEVRRICDLISDLLSFAKSPERIVRSAELEEVVDGVVRLLSPQARERGVVIERSEHVRGATVLVDADQLKQVLVNLVLNAIEASGRETRVKLGVRGVRIRDEHHWQIEVSDEGVGMPTEVLEEIFNPFFTTKSRGTGLGLAISHQIIAEHGGFISVESQEGVGTRFLVHLPMVKVEHEDGEDDWAESRAAV